MNLDYRNTIESLIFASEEEISSKQIKEILDGFNIKLSVKEIEANIADLNKTYIDAGCSFEIIQVAGGYQYSTKKQFALYIGKLFSERQKKKLSPSAIETLAIIAYKQPITRADMEFIRGVNVDYIVNSLLERDLITISGRANSPGRPILYSTTKNFLKVLGINAIEDLPKLKEINDILKYEKVEGITEADIDLFNSMTSNLGFSEKIEFTANELKEGEITEIPSTEINNNEINEIEVQNSEYEINAINYIEEDLPEEKDNESDNDRKERNDTN
ncbi:MAG TPA: SMC-Scp complex subunit ScpB [Ignavibacteria bacterium]|nr:SMC-Scp complex subunit ScpB [Ignavibacteria bacterium]